MTSRPVDGQMAGMEGFPYKIIEGELALADGVIASELSSGFGEIDLMFGSAVGGGGKKLRPAVFLLCARMLGFKSNSLPSLAAAIELLHIASLLHDDIVDRATLRRGGLSVNEKWGSDASVLVGDYIWQRALAILIRSGFEELAGAVTDSVGRMIRGELFELVQCGNPNITKDTYMNVICAKTFEIFSIAARASAVMSGEKGAKDAALGLFGLEVGKAFQLQDDVLDLVSKEKRLGKEVGKDVRTGRLTYPLIVSLERANDGDKNKLKQVISSKKVTDDELQSVISIVERYGGIDETMRVAGEHVSNAKGSLEIFSPSAERSALYEVADYVVKRSS